MAEYLSPAVYIEEQDGIQPIEGVSTSTTGFVGATVRGPVTGLPVLVTSVPEFQRTFGGYFDFGWADALNHLPHAVAGFFTNGGKRLYITRVVGAKHNSSGTKTAQGGLTTRLAADTSLATPDQVKLVTLRNLQVGDQFQLVQTKQGLTTSSGTLDVGAYDRTTNVVTFKAGEKLTSVFEAQYTTVTRTKAASKATFAITAADPGSWGDQIDLRPSHTTAARAQVVGILGAPSPNVQLQTTAGFYPQAWVEFDRGQNKVYAQVQAINGLVVTLTAPLAAGALDPQAPAKFTLASVCEFSLTVSYGGANEQFRRLTLADVPGHYYYDVINNSSKLITVGDPSGLPTTGPEEFPSGDDGLRITLSGGADGVEPIDTDYIGSDGGPGNRTGIQALIDIPAISIIAAPGAAMQTVQEALIDQCELLKYRFAILDPQPGKSDSTPDINAIQMQRGLFDTKYAAIYYPRIMIEDPLSDLIVPIPPSGHMAGIYARVDNARGVHKAPANEVINGIVSLEMILTQGEQDILNPEPNNINVLRDFRHQGRGLRVWGARCITSLTEWKYVNVRRLMIFLEASIDAGTQWAVFEPNAEALWARVRQSISNFLVTVWRDGALMGTTQDEAFFVKCDATTMTQDDIDNGRLIVLVGVAPVKPAEFVIIRIGQKLGGSTTQEL